MAGALPGLSSRPTRDGRAAARLLRSGSAQAKPIAPTPLVLRTSDALGGGLGMKRRSAASAGGPEPKRRRAGAVAAAASSARAAARSPGPKGRVDDKTQLRRVLRLIHPDKYMGNKEAYEINSQSLKVSARQWSMQRSELASIFRACSLTRPFPQVLNGYVEAMAGPDTWRILAQSLRFLVTDGDTGRLREVCSSTSYALTWEYPVLMAHIELVHSLRIAGDMPPARRGQLTALVSGAISSCYHMSLPSWPRTTTSHLFAGV